MAIHDLFNTLCGFSAWAINAEVFAIETVISVSEHTLNTITILSVAITMPIVGIGKIFFSQVMRKNTTIHTRIGDWLVRMFIAIGASFILFGSLYGSSFAIDQGWVNIPIILRQITRLLVTTTSIFALFATGMCVHSLIPLLRSSLITERRYDSEQTVAESQESRAV